MYHRHHPWTDLIQILQPILMIQMNEHINQHYNPLAGIIVRPEAWPHVAFTTVEFMYPIN